MDAASRGLDDAPADGVGGAMVLHHLAGGGVMSGGRGPLRPHSTPATLLWLEANYEMADGVCIPRSTLYSHYVHFCAGNGLQPVNAASFGKIIRQQFPLLTTRRLGTRGQSRYHYYGIAIRETSVYFEVSYSKKGLSVSEGRRESIRQNGFSQTRYKLTTHLPEFPSIRDISLPDGVPADRVSSFLMMYRTHCQRIFDTIMRASMEEVHNFLLHFWQGMPPHLVGILSTNVVVNMVGVCDSILYRTICNVLMQSVLQALPDNLLQVIRKFALELEVWLHLALEDLPPALRNMKMSLAHSFSKMLKRQSSLHHLCQAAQMVIFNTDLINQMLLDLRKVDLQAICRQTMYTMNNMEGSIVTQLITGLFHEFEQLLEGQAAIETYVEWLESIIERCVLHPANSAMSGSTPCLRHLARQFLLVWTGFGTRVIRDMTLHSAPSFGSFHLLHLMFDDYVFHLVDILHLEDRAKEMLRNANLNTQPDFDTHWESTDADDILFASSIPPCPPSLLPDYARLQHMSDDAQGNLLLKDVSDLAHQGAVHGEFVTASEQFPGPLHYETDFRIGCKNPGRNYVYQNSITQSSMEAEPTMPDMLPTPSQSTNDKSSKFANSAVLSYGSCDENPGISSHSSVSRRAEQNGMSSADSHFYQDSNIGMNSHSSGGYYHYYNSNVSYPNNRY